MRFDMHAPSLAQYHWSTLFCRFSTAVPFDKSFAVRTMAALSRDRAIWEDDAQFRAAVALLHELTHLAQDLTTGLGHWDFMTHWTNDAALLQQAGLMLARRDHPLPYAFPRDAGHKCSKFVPFDMMAPVARDRLRMILERDVQQPLTDATLFDYSPQALMESDAAGAVLSWLGRMKLTPLQAEIQSRNLDLVDPGKLGDVYWSSRVNLYQVLQHHCDTDEDQTITIGDALFGIFTDIALAHPSSEWCLLGEEREAEFEPTVKFGRLLIAFQALAGSSMERFMYALMDRKYLEAERLLLAAGRWCYPSSEQIYEGWQRVLKTQSDQSLVADLRRGACEFRLENGVVLPARDIDTLFALQAPIIYLTADAGFVKVDWNSRAMESNLISELLDRFTVMELADFLVRTGEFRCPYATAEACDVAEDGCYGGFVHLAQFPAAAGCTARQALEHFGVHLPR
jgi:hypothetical protein